MEYWMLIPAFTAGAVFGFACCYWVRQREIEDAQRDCRLRQMELNELRGEVLRTTKNTSLMRRWAMGVR
jgi:hypothetical protein